MQTHYYFHLSDYLQWDQKEHSEQWILFPQNIGEHLSIDETSLSQGELYTVITNKAGRGKKGSLVAMVKGTVSKTVIEVLEKIEKSQRDKVVEITADLAPSMNLIAKKSFPNATIVADRFHVQKLASDAVQELRIKLRWDAIEMENKERELAKEMEEKFTPTILANGDTEKQLLARSRYLLFKSEAKWTPKQAHRAEILFEHYPLLKRAYDLSRSLSNVFNKIVTKQVAYKKLALWYQEVENAPFNHPTTCSFGHI